LYVANIDDQLIAPQDRALLARWRAASSTGTLPHIRLLDSGVMSTLGDCLTVAERNRFGEFNFLYCGDTVADQLGINLTSKTTADLPPRTGTQTRRSFIEAVEVMAPTFSIDRATDCGHVHLWGRLHLPFRDNSGALLIVTLHRPREYTDELLRDILDAAPDGILAVRALRDPTHRVTDFSILAINAVMAEFLRADTTQMMSRTVLETFPHLKKNGTFATHLRVLETRQSSTFESNLSLCGRDRWFRVVSAPLGDGLVISYTDITELKTLNMQLEKQRKRLEEEVARRINVERELWDLAHLDPLTGLENRRSIQHKAERALALAAEAGVSCTLIEMDIDHFKSINDSHGHAAGDAAIRAVAEAARSAPSHANDILARIGGEEFALLLYDCTLERGLAVAETLRKTIAGTKVRCGDKEFSLTLSFGIAASSGSSTYENLLGRADQALYRAKRGGRNQTKTDEQKAA
jgi:diguanylate cyclase (GGDEF)-like protein